MNINKTIMHRFYLLLILAISLAISCSTTPEQLPDDMSGPLTQAPPEVKALPFNDSDIIPIANSPTRGPDAARVTIVMFTDLQCPFCQRAVLTVAQLQQSYPDEVKLVLKHNPLPFHKEAPAAAYATIAAGNQGFYWEMHDWIFSKQGHLRQNSGSIKEWTAQYAGQLGMDVAQFEADFGAPETLAIVARDMELAQKLGARGTPTFFINGERLVGAQPLMKFEEVVNTQIKKAHQLAQAGVDDADLYRQLVAANHNAKTAKPPSAEAKPAVKAAPIQFIPVEANDAHLGNSKDALVTIVEFSDFQCPFCARVTPTVKQIHDTYGDKVRIVFKQHPLAFHTQARFAAQAALAAHLQGKYIEMHDLLFNNQREFSKHADDFEAYAAELAGELGLDVAKFGKDYQSKAIAEQIERDIQLAAKVGARGTPSFWINGIQLMGAQPFDRFKALIDPQLAQAQQLKDAKKLSGDALYQAAVAQNIANAPAPAPAPAAERPAEPSAKVDLADLALGDAPVKGSESAAVTIVAFSDFQCPFCQRGDANLQKAVAKYDGKVKIAFKHFPLPFHPHAKPAARAALAAGEQGKFWQMHDLLFENQRILNDAELYPKLAKQLGLNVEKFEKDMKKPAYDTLIDQDMAQGAKLGVRGTPAFFINGERVSGAQPVENFEAAIERALKEAK